MPKSFYLCWVDDVPGFPQTFNGHLDLLGIDHDAEFIIDEHTSTNNFDSIARNFDDDLICFVDFNLKDGDGNGLDGNQVIDLIRKHNTTCKIIFYSSKATQEELQDLSSIHKNVICVPRENLRDILTDIATGDI